MPIALMAAAAVHAAPTFNAPTTTTVTSILCVGGSPGGSVTGSATNGGLGLTLSGTGSLGGSDWLKTRAHQFCNGRAPDPEPS